MIIGFGAVYFVRISNLSHFMTLCRSQLLRVYRVERYRQSGKYLPNLRFLLISRFDDTPIS